MKQISTIIILLIAFSSCKKDYTCECTATTLNPRGTTTIGEAQTTTYSKIKRSEAKSICQTSTLETENANGAVTIITNNCKLK